MRNLELELGDPHTDAPSPAALFDAALSASHQQTLRALGFRVIARPGGDPTHVRPGDCLIRRALGEGRLAIVATVTGAPETRAQLQELGIACEGRSDGLFVPVEFGDGRSSALRIADLDGVVVPDTVVLRRRVRSARRAPRRAARTRTRAARARLDEPALEQASEDGPVPRPLEPPIDANLLPAVLALRARGLSRLSDSVLRSLLEGSGAALASELQRALLELRQRVSAESDPGRRAMLLEAVREELSRTLLRSAERRFISDATRSTLELLERSEQERFLTFAWDANDFPGEPSGPNETRAEALFQALSRLRPERRANQGASAVVTRAEFDAAMQARVDAALVDVPGERGRLEREASAAYVRMREAAALEGVTLRIGSAHRSATRAASAAARAGNAAAVASFSSHTLGLAVDLNMSHGTLRYSETSTRPFQGLVNMYKSPVHKWMFLRGDTYGFFPYQREPWHWEYNPPGFRDSFRAGGSRPAQPAAESASTQ